MTTTPADLVPLGHHFAADINDLLNRTVTNGVRVTAVLDDHECRIACGISPAEVEPALIPLTIDAKPATCYLDLVHRFRFDDEGKHLMNTKARMAVYADDGDSEPWFRYEYVRDNPVHAEAHLHVHADLVGVLPAGVRPLARQHLPVGGRRFRVSLEDVIEFLVRERYAEPRPGWEDAIERHRRAWYERQLAAAVRRDPEIARAELKRIGKL